MAIEQTPLGTPQRVRRAHASIATIYEFLGKYNRWLAELGAEACDFALGNPQTLPLLGSVVYLRGYIRASITASDAMIDRALPVFARVRERITPL